MSMGAHPCDWEVEQRKITTNLRPAWAAKGTLLKKIMTTKTDTQCLEL